MRQDWSPCKIVEYPAELGDPRYAVTFDDFESTRAHLDQKGFESDGYTWSDIIEAVIRQSQPDMLSVLAFDSEASMFCVRSSNLDALGSVVTCIRAAIQDSNVIDRALGDSGKTN
jgi:hypothetical protein